MLLGVVKLAKKVKPDQVVKRVPVSPKQLPGKGGFRKKPRKYPPIPVPKNKTEFELLIY